jgi:radical SAM superfamily enzyme YgiQ (UPF0313 family)
MNSQAEGGRLGASRPLRRLSICIINPRYEPSFWGFDYALPLMPGNMRYSNVTGALPAIAALTPSSCEVTLLDENVEPIDYEALRRFDVIGVTGMIVQAQRMREILVELKKLPAAVIVVGGAYVTVAEEWFDGYCDVRFIGEAEETWPAFLSALAAGEPVAARYEQSEKTDMTKVPTPRFDLIDPTRYQMASLQFSRGCPFLCEFCDIITIFGRRPRLKTIDQMLKEFDAVRRAGFRSCFLADDNFIGNKKAAKALLQATIAWQRSHSYPLQFYTQASINLADDAELINLMTEANFRNVFIGIESPRKDSLAETRKVQNLVGDSIEAKIQRVRDGGMVVNAGFIIGFDSDDDSIFEEHFDFIQRSGIAQAAVGILTPIPTTPLYDRLKAEGRLDLSDSAVIFHPKQMTRETLKDNYARLTRRLYQPEAYFGRLFDGYSGSPAYRRRYAEREAYTRGAQTLWDDVRRVAGGAVQAGKFTAALSRDKLLWRLGRTYLKVWLTRNLPLGRDAIRFEIFVRLCVVHWHFYKIIHLPMKNRFGAVAQHMPAEERIGRVAAAASL